MIERRPLGNLLPYAVLTAGVVVVTFPIYYTFIAS
jgi:hypothetical protein